MVSGFNTKNSSESIFEVVNTPQDNLGSNSLGYFYNQHESYGDALATHDLYNIYAPTDVRRQFMKIGDRNASGAEVNVPLVLKYGTILAGNQDIIVIRLAEVYLNRAEAEAHLGKDAAAIADFSKIAKRADPTVKINQNLTGQALINRILLERRKELAFEGQRLWSLTRNKKSFTKYLTNGKTDGNKKLIKYPNNHTILPIPQPAINVNPNLTQNPGY